MNKTFSPTPDVEVKSSKLYKAMVRRDIKEAPRLVLDGMAMEIPADLANVFRAVLEDFSQGKPITIITHETKLTTQQVADFLGVSRPTAIKLLSEYEIPVQKVNRHRKVSFHDAQRLAGLIRQKQSDTLRDMIKRQVELGLLDDVNP